MGMTQDVLISVVIPVKNGDAWLSDTIGALLRQSIINKCEIIIIDSGSTDATRNILKAFPVRVIEINADEFNHGETRNLGAKLSTGSYVAMTVQDAKPIGDSWLRDLLECFDDDKVAGVCGQQIVPHDPDKNPIEWFKPISQPAKTKYYYPNFIDFERLTLAAQKKICSWDNVNALYRREYLLKVPFRKVGFAEDIMWAKDALQAGYSIVYNNFAKVEHYHHDTADSIFKRNFTGRYHLYKYFGIIPKVDKDNFVAFLRNIKTLVGTKGISLGSKLKWLGYNMELRKAIMRSDNLFIQTLNSGVEALDLKHAELCKEAPQALKPIG
jgi:rhamnosyltransferase